VILEPAAYAGMIGSLMLSHMGLLSAERGFSVFSNPKGGTKIGLKVNDERISWVSDPMDRDGPFCPFSPSGTPFDRTYWIQDGILKNLSYGDDEAIKRQREYGVANPLSVRIQPAEGMKLMTLEEMISTCEKGIYVTRLTGGYANFRYATFTGVTRDGTWLIEKGKITRPIKNLRYLDSPMFFLNSLEAVGKPELVPGMPPSMVLPPLRVRELNFTALADAV
jgi:predicted Zn-dependent protease